MHDEDLEALVRASASAPPLGMRDRVLAACNPALNAQIRARRRSRLRAWALAAAAVCLLAADAAVEREDSARLSALLAGPPSATALSDQPPVLLALRSRRAAAQALMEP